MKNWPGIPDSRRPRLTRRSVYGPTTSLATTDVCSRLNADIGRDGSGNTRRFAAGAGLGPAGGAAPTAVRRPRRRGLIGDPWVPPCFLSSLLLHRSAPGG